MKLSEDLIWRGLIKDKTFEDPKWLDEPRGFYHGIDASGDSMQIGNLAAMILARRLIADGWKAVLLAGGATSLIGDPGGKAEERELKPRAEIEKNIEAIKAQIHNLFAGQRYTPADNYDWFKDILYLDFLRDIGKQFSMTELMQREFVSERMGQGGSGISYAEFSYSLVQGYDYWRLYKDHKVELQIGGSDQWGNMLSGVSLVRKKENKEVHALSMPLVVNKTTGQKFGKSEAGAIWLDPAKTTPTEFYQFWINTSDEDVENYLKIFTLLPKEEIEQLISDHKTNPSRRLAQVRLAEEVTRIVHGSPESGAATSVTKYLTGQAAISEAGAKDLDEIRQEIPHVKVQPGAPLIDVLVETGLAKSNSEARRLQAAGAIYLNNEKFEGAHLDAKHFQNGRLLLRRGKAYKDSALIELL